MKKEFKLLDGAMGTYLQYKEKDKSKRTDYYNIFDKDLVCKIHSEYIKAGANIINTNTFISNYLWDKGNFDVEEAIRSGIKIAKKAVENKNVLVALDIGPSQDINKNHFKNIILIGQSEGVDLYIAETFTNLEEAKLLIDIWKKESDRPLILSFSLEKDFLLTDGSSLKEIVEAVEECGLLALGLNCGLGLNHCYEGLLKLKQYTDMELMAKPNLGYEKLASKEEFLDFMKKISKFNVKYIGGCCGSTPEYIYELKMNFNK